MSLVRTLPLLALLAPLAGCAAGATEEGAVTTDAISEEVPTGVARSAVGTLMDGDEARCTGTLIAANVVLTTARCVSGKAKLELALADRAGDTHRYAPLASGDERHPYAYVHPRFDAEGRDLAYVLLAEQVPAALARPARVGSHRNVDDCAFDVVSHGERTTRVCVTAAADTGRLAPATPSGATCLGDQGSGLLVSGMSAEVLVGVVSGADDCAATALASESAFIQRAFAAGARVRGSVAFDE